MSAAASPAWVRKSTRLQRDELEHAESPPPPVDPKSADVVSLPTSVAGDTMYLIEDHLLKKLTLAAVSCFCALLVGANTPFSTIDIIAFSEAAILFAFALGIVVAVFVRARDKKQK